MLRYLEVQNMKDQLEMLLIIKRRSKLCEFCMSRLMTHGRTECEDRARILETEFAI